MAQIREIRGIKEVLQKLKERTEAFAVGTERGLKKAGLALQAASVRLVPVNFGILKASAYTRPSGKGFATQVNVGYTASYALYVHEAVGMVLKGQPRPKGRGFYWDPQGRAQAKFLEEPARRIAKELKAIIAKEVKIK